MTRALIRLTILLSLVLASPLVAWDRVQWPQIGANSTDTINLTQEHTKQYRTASPSIYFDRVMINQSFAVATTTGEIFLDGISRRLALSASGSMVISGLITAVDPGSPRKYFGAWINGMLLYDAASGTRLIGGDDGEVVSIVFEDPPGVMSLVATTTVDDGSMQLIASTTASVWGGWLEILVNTK